MATTSLARLLQDQATSRLSHYLRILSSHVAHNSFTGHAANVRSFAQLTQRDLFPANRFASIAAAATPEAPEAPETPCPHVFMRSIAESDVIRPQIALVSHLDTVFPPLNLSDPTSNPFNWKEALLLEANPSSSSSSPLPEYRHIAIGPGTMDIKGGTVVMAMALEVLRECAPTHYGAVDWRILLNAAEEIMDPSFPEVAFGLGVVSRERPPLACLVFENGPLRRRGNDLTFGIVTGRKGMGIWRVGVSGREAHAGNAHATGANAIVALAHLVSRFASLTDYSRQVTVNVGTITGGTTTNTVPGQAHCTLEMRASDITTYNEVKARLGSLVEEDIKRFPGCSASMVTLTEAPPWMENAGTASLLNTWNEAGKIFGNACGPLGQYSCIGEKRGGVSDGNRFWDLCPTLDGLGPTGFNAHSAVTKPGETVGLKKTVTWLGKELEVLTEKPEQEYVELDSIVPKVVLNVLALHQLITAHYRSLGVNV